MFHRLARWVLIFTGWKTRNMYWQPTTADISALTKTLLCTGLVMAPAARWSGKTASSATFGQYFKASHISSVPESKCEEKHEMKKMFLGLCCLFIVNTAFGYERKIPVNSKVYVAPMDGF